VSRKRLAAASLIIITAISLSGCAVGFDAATSQQKPSGNGANKTSEALEIRDATLVADPAQPGKAVLIVTVYNKGENADALVGLQGESGFTGTSSGDLTIPAHQVLRVGFNSPNEIVVAGTAKSLAPGQFVNVTFAFQNTYAVTMSLYVAENNGIYQGIKIPETAAVLATDT